MGLIDSAILMSQGETTLIGPIGSICNRSVANRNNKRIGALIACFFAKASGEQRRHFDGPAVPDYFERGRL